MNIFLLCSNHFEVYWNALMVWRGHTVYDTTHKGYYIGIYADFLNKRWFKKE